MAEKDIVRLIFDGSCNLIYGGVCAAGKDDTRTE